MKAIITVGISASGKTTWTKEFVRKNGNYININRDDIRFSLFGLNTWSDYKFSRDKEKLVTSVQWAMVYAAASSGKNVIISDTNLSSKYRKKLEKDLVSFGYDIEIKEFPVSYEEAVKRDARRENGVGHTVIWAQYKKWLQYKGGKTYVPDKSLYPAVIVDVDGTVANMEGIRGPFDWDKVDQDKLVKEVSDIVHGLNQMGATIVFLSGRDGQCFDKTKDWLNEHFNIVFELYMREEGDCRKDSIVKEEMFWKYIAPKYNVKMVIDDRPQVVCMWNSLGLKTICVSDPYVEF